MTLLKRLKIRISFYIFTLLLSFSLSCLSTWAITPAEEPIVNVVEKTMPAVVNIQTDHVVQQLMATPMDLFFRRFQIGQETVHSLGSGLLVSPDGYIVTNHHVIQMSDTTNIRVSLFNGSVYQAKFISSDPDKDLALIKITDSKTPFTFLDFKTLSPNLLGETVIALGNPVGYQNSVSHGILSAKNRSFTAEGVTMEGLLQTDAAINPGNSGGPLVDINGNLVGINSAKFAGVAIEGIGFAIPAETVSSWVGNAIAVAKGLKPPEKPVSLLDILRNRFGINLQEETPEMAFGLGFSTPGGLLITSVEPGSSAEEAGLKKGMLIVGIGSYPVLNEQSLPREILHLKKGDTALFTVVSILEGGGLKLQRSAEVELEAR